MRILFCAAVLAILSHTAFAQEGKFISNEFYQNQIPSASKSASLGSFGNVPVNYYTGLPEISYNLLTLNSRELSVPISINYDATGVRTDELSGPVGLKWQISAGGFVERALTGLPDEDPSKGYLKYAKETDYYQNLPDVGAWVNASEKNELDCGPDEFVIAIPGRSIKFVFDKNGWPVPTSREKVSITYLKVNNKIDKFSLVTEDGVTYLFGGTTSSVEQRKIESLNLSLKFRWTTEPYHYPGGSSYQGPGSDPYYAGFENYTNEYEAKEKTIDYYNSKWHLIQILAPSGDKVDFNYTKFSNEIKYVTKPVVTTVRPLVEKLISYQSRDQTCSQSIYAVKRFGVTDPGKLPFLYWNPAIFSPDSVAANPGGAFVNQSLITESCIILNSIQAANGNIVTFISSAREDLPNSYKYEAVKLINMNSQTIADIRLNYAVVNASVDNDFFWVSEAIMMSKISSLQAGTYYANVAKSFSEADISDPGLVVSLFPTVVVFPLKKYVFEGLKDYNYKRLFLESIEDRTSLISDPIKLYTFGYKDRHLLRRRTTPLYDYLGFSRDEFTSEDHKIKTGATGKMSNSIIPTRHLESTVVNRFPDRGILNRIAYQTNGFTQFVFEKNRGAKLKLIQDFDAGNLLLSQTEFEYTAAASISPFFHALQDFRVKDSNKWMKKNISSSMPQSEGNLTKGFVEGNKTTKVYRGGKAADIGYEVYTFTYPGIFTVQDNVCVKDAGDNTLLDFRDLDTKVFAFPVDVNEAGQQLTQGFADGSVFPFLKQTNRDHLRGLLLEHTVNRNDGQVIKRTKNCYKLNPYNYSPQEVYGFKGGAFVYTSHDETSFWEGYYDEPDYRYRWGRYKISNEWIVLDKTTEWIYDQNNPATSLSRSQTYTYDPVNLQQIETRAYQENSPTTAIITKTKYATDAQYNYTSQATVNCDQQYNNCTQNCTTPECVCWEEYTACLTAAEAAMPSETSAILHMRMRQQTSTPVEVQTLLEMGGTTKVLKSIAYKFQRLMLDANDRAKDYVKPKEIWQSIKPTDLANFTSSYVNQSNGQFVIDGAMRKVHSFDSYDASNGNLLQQTSFDGTVSVYDWSATYNKSLVSKFTINPGAQQQEYNYVHKPLVGVLTNTDPNGITTKSEYDGFNRLTYTKDYANNILSRTRYHYASQSESLTASINISGYKVNGAATTFSTEANPAQFSETTYAWNFGDGTTATVVNNNVVEHIYNAVGNYNVTLTKSNPEYGSATAVAMATIYSAPTISVCANGPVNGDKCGIQSMTYGSCTTAQNQNPGYPTYLNATAGSGCGGYTYNWEYQVGSGSIVSFGSGATQEQIPLTTGNYNIRCRITDSCGNVKASAWMSINLYKSDPYCPDL